jgi:protein-S-isoprenylcysteine O-methyltransferase Ste14
MTRSPTAASSALPSSDTSSPSKAPTQESPNRQRLSVRLGKFLFVARNFLFPLVFVVLLFTTQPAFPFGSEQADHWMDLFGVLVAVLGQGCRALAVGQAENIRRGGREKDGRKKQMFAKGLIRHGIYAHTRNPLYLGNLLILTGLSLIANNLWWYVLVWPAFVGIYWSIIQAEEDFLPRPFGAAYVDYCRTVNRLLPKRTGLLHTIVGNAFDWKRVLRKEYSIACSWLSMATGLLIWERWQRFGYTERAVEIQELLVCLLVVFVFYVGMVGIRIFQKARSRGPAIS